MNEFIFLFHTIIIALASLGALLIGKEALVGFICIQSILSNLFVTKQITLFGLTVTCTDVFAVGALLSLNMLQEFFGRDIVKKTILINFFMLIFYVAMSQLHLWYIPNSFDSMHQHFASILSIMPRITIASVSVYGFVQLFDAQLFSILKQLFNSKYLVIRNIISLTCSQLLDTILFSYLALYGIVESVWHVIIVSFIIKLFVIACNTPFIALAKKVRSTKKTQKRRETL